MQVDHVSNVLPQENSSSQTKPAAPTQEKQATTPAAADVVPKKKMPRKNKTKSKKKQHRKTAISDGEASIGVDSDMDTRAFMEEYDKREGKPYDAVIQKLGLFVCGSACATDDSIYEEVSISSPPRKKTREFDTIAPKGTRTSIGGGSTKPQKSKQVRPASSRLTLVPLPAVHAVAHSISQFTCNFRRAWSMELFLIARMTIPTIERCNRKMMARASLMAKAMLGLSLLLALPSHPLWATDFSFEIHNLHCMGLCISMNSRNCACI